MFLKSFSIYNYRKYGEKNNTVNFASNGNGSDVNHVLKSTLIIGQNNAGKTSIVTALKKASGADDFKVTDFNFDYLFRILKIFFENKDEIRQYLNGKDSSANRTLIKSLLPSMKFFFEFQLDGNLEDSEELLTNISPLIHNEIDSNDVITACVKYSNTEDLNYISSLYDTFENEALDEDPANRNFEKFIKFLNDGTKFSKKVYSDVECNELVNGFRMQDLIQVDSVSFKSLHTAGRLSAAFNDIYKFKANNDPESKQKFENQVNEINKRIDDSAGITKELTNRVNTALSKTMDRSHASMQLRSNLTVDSLLKNVIRYVYRDGNFEIPEDQFGMGYTNLMLIIAQLVDYVDDSPESTFRNKINLLLIEEPESYMHPQMQRVLIQNLDDSVQTILDQKDIKLNCQLVITSHSSNIVYGKLHTENTFDNINYIASFFNKPSEIVPLQDKELSPKSEKNNDKEDNAEFSFLKKHLQYNACELFFADACIIVEGYAEATLLPYYIEREESLSKKYISLLTINGAYAQVYNNLLKRLKTPTAVITDIDLKSVDEQHNIGNNQVFSLDNLKTTNAVLNGYIKQGKYKLGDTDEICDDNIHIFTQSRIDKYYPTSFEEALILSNSANEILNETLKETMPNIYRSCNGDITSKSHFLLNKLGSNGYKGDFATKLLFNIVNNGNDKIPVLPKYISDALEYINKALEKSDKI